MTEVQSWVLIGVFASVVIGMRASAAASTVARASASLNRSPIRPAYPARNARRNAVAPPPMRPPVPAAAIARVACTSSDPNNTSIWRSSTSPPTTVAMPIFANHTVRARFALPIAVSSSTFSLA